MRLFALIFALAFAAVQMIFIAAYFRWLGAGWPLAPAAAVFLVGVPAVIPLLPDDRLLPFLSRHLWLSPLVAQTQSPVWQVVNTILAIAGAWLGFGWEWWPAALLLLALLIAPRLAGELIRRRG